MFNSFLVKMRKYIFRDEKILSKAQRLVRVPLNSKETLEVTFVTLNDQRLALAAISQPSLPSGWKTLMFIERLLRNHWEIDEIIECSLRDRVEKGQNLDETVVTENQKIEISGNFLIAQREPPLPKGSITVYLWPII